MTALQRLKSVVATGRTHANRHKAVAGLCDRRTDEDQLHKVLRPKNLCAAATPHRLLLLPSANSRFRPQAAMKQHDPKATVQPRPFA